MPDIEESRSAQSGIAPDSEAARPSRRSVLRGAAGAGAAGLAATVLAGAAFPAAASASTGGRDSAAAHEDPAGEIVAHVRNARTGEIDVYRGTTHIRLHDRGLAAQLIRASK